jgi:hypothetical protein
MTFKTSIVLSVCIVVVGQASAQARDCTVSQLVPHVSESQSAYVLATSGMEVLGIARGSVFATEDPDTDLIVGALEGVDVDASPASVMVVLEGKGQVVSSQTRKSSLDAEPLFLMDAAAMQARVREQRGVLQRAANVPPEEISLKKINEETEQLLKFERVVGGQDAPSDGSAERTRMEEVRVILKQHLEALKTRSQPGSFKKRESELTEQLNLMSTSLHARDQAIREGLAGLSPELEQKIELIKATQGEHIDLLRRELAQLKRERAKAESASARGPLPQE